MKHSRSPRWLVLLAAAVLLGAFVLAQSAPTATSSAATAPAELVRGNTEFAVGFYSELRTTRGNLAFSPASLSLALAMTYTGARGETASAMAHVLHVAANTSTVPMGFHTLVRQWSHPTTAGAYQLDVANRLYGEQTYTFRTDFLTTTAAQYDAPLEPTDWIHGAEAARTRINDWVVRQTHERIRDLIPPGGVNSATRLLLVNAIYFHGAWRSAFHARDTQPATFHLDTHATVSTPMMHQTAHFRYARVGSVQIVELPYRGGDLAFDVVVPDAIDGLGAVEGSLSAATIERWTASLADTEVALSLPRFHAQTSAPATSILLALGMGVAFDAQRADFGGMAGSTGAERLHISDVFHKAFVEINEEGTEAAAATGVVMSNEAPRSVIADHPFLYLLRDLRSGSVLFMGRVANPAG